MQPRPYMTLHVRLPIKLTFSLFNKKRPLIAGLGVIGAILNCYRDFQVLISQVLFLIFSSFVILIVCGVEPTLRSQVGFNDGCIMSLVKQD